MELPGVPIENLTRRTPFSAANASVSEGATDEPADFGCLRRGGDQVPSSSSAADVRDLPLSRSLGSRQGAVSAACAESTNCGEKLLAKAWYQALRLDSPRPHGQMAAGKLPQASMRHGCTEVWG
eukprot:CAMPEP_0172902608 /NCGR_PEP_ID=MMETSP1075-20121228/168768_1 /TAXON_ID=2916 /ORGANISM="Ceratium fusus, Strain PA161109" /LENGTH=123 /DNA_ID=CAMNT_0013759237 /DNA_START=489 /DNA_END=858 /DNA_ORIENTATION=-